MAAPAAAGAAPTPLVEVGEAGTGSGQLTDPFGVALDGAGNLYVADTGNHRISVFTPAGDFKHAFGFDVIPPDGPSVFEVCTLDSGCKTGDTGGGSGQLTTPYSVALDGAGGRLYVGELNARISVFDVSGASPVFLHAFGRDVDEPNADPPAGTFEVCTTMCRMGDAPGTGIAGELSWPRDLALDGAGRLHVADVNQSRINVFTSPGTSPTFLHAFGWDVIPVNMDTDFEVCTTATMCKTGNAAGGGGQLDSPQGVAFDAAGRLHVGEKDNERISVFSSPGTSPAFLHAFGWNVIALNPGMEFEVCDDSMAAPCINGDGGGGDGQLNQPEGVAIDAAGRLQVADQMNHRVTVFGSTGSAPSFVHAYGIDVAEPNDPFGGAFEVCMLDPGPFQGCRTGDVASSAFGKLDSPRGIEADCQGAVWVTDQNLGMVKRFGEPGTPLPPPCPVAATPIVPTSPSPIGTTATAPPAPTAKKKCKRKKKRGRSVAVARKCKRKKPRR